MDIKYLGHASFLLKGKTDSVVMDPFDKSVGLKFPEVSAGIVTVSHDHPDHNAVSQVEGSPLVLNIPGEYEKNGIRLTGFGVYHDNKRGEERGRNTLFRVDVDGISVLHCGDLGHTLFEELTEEIGEIDVLLVPVGGFYTIDSKTALEVIKSIEPSIVIPMHYQTDKHSPTFADVAPLSEFLKQMDITAVEPVKKLTLKPGDFGEEMKVIVMETN